MTSLIYLCSTNKGKLREFAIAAQNEQIALEVLPQIAQIEAPEENGKTFEENAILKAVYYSRFSDEVVLSDDSGLVVDALAGAPGIYSARYAGPDATAEQNNDLLLEKLKGISNRSARFVAVIALARGGRILTTARGTVSGSILEQPSGALGFGYDPLFFCPALNCSFGEAHPEQKLSVSHRGQALRNALRDWPALLKV